MNREEVGGEAGIRTLDTAFGPYNGLANRRLQPLGHLTARCKYTRTKSLWRVLLGAMRTPRRSGSWRFSKPLPSPDNWLSAQEFAILRSGAKASTSVESLSDWVRSSLADRGTLRRLS